MFISNLAFPSETIYLTSGDEFEGNVTRIYDRKIDFVSLKKHSFPYDLIAAIKVNGVLSNGPFNLIVMGQLFPTLVEDGGSKNKIDSRTNDSIVEEKQILAVSGDDLTKEEADKNEHPSMYLKYGTISSFHMNYGPGGGSTSSFSKVFSRCYKSDGKSECGEPQWIGFVGEDLAGTVAGVPEAAEKAAKIKTTTAVQVVSLIATPVFLFSFVSLANGPKDENGNVKTHVGPGAITCLVLTGLAFSNYIGWNIYEGFVARKSIEIYNQKIGVSAKLKSQNLNLSFNVDIKP